MAVAVFGTVAVSAADKDRKSPQERAEQRAAKIDIDKHIQAINRLDNSPAKMRAGMEAVSKETAVPVARLEANHKAHPRVGLAGIFVAHELAISSHKPVEQFLKAHQDGRTWASLAKGNNESLETLDAKLSRIEQAMRDAK